MMNLQPVITTLCLSKQIITNPLISFLAHINHWEMREKGIVPKLANFAFPNKFIRNISCNKYCNLQFFSSSLIYEEEYINTKSLISARDKSKLGKIHTHTRLGQYVVQGENCCDNVFSLQLCFLPKLETTWCVVINDPKGNPKGILVMNS